MTGQQKQDGTIDKEFIQGLDLILGSLIQKNDVGTLEARSAADDDVNVQNLEDSDPQAVEKGGYDKKWDPNLGYEIKQPTIGTQRRQWTESKGLKAIADKDAKAQVAEGINKKISPATAALAGAAAEPLVAATADRIRGKKTEKSQSKGESPEDGTPQTDSLNEATDLGDKTNLPPEMGRKGDKGKAGLVDDGSIAEPMLRRRKIRKSVLDDIERGVDLFQLWANVDRVIEKSSDYSPHVSDIDILKSFGLCECTDTGDIGEGTLIHKMLTDRGSRPSSEWWNECVTFAKSVDGMLEPAFFAAFMYYEPKNFRPEHFMKGLNDTGHTPRTSRRGASHDTEIDENIGAMGGQAIDGLGMSNDGKKHDDDESEDAVDKQADSEASKRAANRAMVASGANASAYRQDPQMGETPVQEAVASPVTGFGAYRHTKRDKDLTKGLAGGSSATDTVSIADPGSKTCSNDEHTSKNECDCPKDINKGKG